jgi:HD-GYP domain-containing protein (c-di-GMP phosphodiesterase class II)
MPLEERQIAVDSLTLGMFVCRLDRPWTETPFPLQGFLVESLSDIETLRRYSSHVYIDVEKSIDRTGRGLLLRLGWRSERPGRPRLPDPAPYRDSIPLDDELPRATLAWDSVRSYASRCIDDIRAGRRVSIDELGAAMEPIVASVVRNADAYFWLDALRERDPYAYSHAINCCALAATFGRHLGFPRSLLVDLASGGLLMDIGMALLPEGTCNHPGPLDDGQRESMRRHVVLGMERLDSAGLSNADVAEMILGHHERYDGAGYPSGLSGLSIPLTARMLAVVDAFDALCSERPHQQALSRHHALQAIYRERDRQFQGELVEQFSQCLGVYPTGSLVELTTGEVAVVMAQNPARRLFPRVTIVTRADKTVDPSFRQVDLWSTVDDAGRRASIARALAPGAYGLELSEYFL